MRKFPRTLLILALASALAVSVLKVWGEDLLVYYIEPSEPFDSTILAARPDYGDDRFWAALPDKASAAQLVPEGLPDPAGPRQADVFYIHPTSYISGKTWNSPLFSDSRAWEMVDVILGAQASAFNLCCNVYAPHYRQAALASFLAFDRPDGAAALDLAYADIASAFEEFLARIGDRPFVVASHSQGTYHALRLLAEQVDGRAIQQRMVAAYLVGYWLPMDTFGRTMKHIEPCNANSDIACVLHWSTYGEHGVRRNGVPHWYPGGAELSDGKPLLCNNPLNWQREGRRVPASEHPGALYVARGGGLLYDLLNLPTDIELKQLPALLPHWTWAECRDGLLHVAEQVNGPFGEFNSDPRQDYHLADYSLFYQSIRENAWERVARFAAQYSYHPSPSVPDGLRSRD
ncbi:DUF3089 domain-containing protein [Parahaliea maris]|uniref:DUF3089 domain-containing protein n=1 Tax=Parahaliea maris TaxID=2716870 RepID=A0A5C9A560_9GAMM|nr:DUF3089 domain-containing protein [Parahaliea maris]TXS95866.1 DUF3089 domain-containing protein [Parahaliea maris]